MPEIKFETTKEMLDFLRGLENEITELEQKKRQKIDEYKQITTQILGAPSIHDLTLTRFVEFLEKLSTLKA